MKTKLNINKIKDIIISNIGTIKNDYYVSRIGVFGSYSCGDETDKSDIDILVSLDQTKKKNITLIDIGGLQIYLSKILDSYVDLVIEDELSSRPNIKNIILEEVQYIDE